MRERPRAPALRIALKKRISLIAESGPDRNGGEPEITPALPHTMSSGSSGYRQSPRRRCRSIVPVRISRTHGCHCSGSEQGFRSCSCGISGSSVCPAAGSTCRRIPHSYDNTCPVSLHRKKYDSSDGACGPATDIPGTGSSAGDGPCRWRSPCRRVQ